MSRLNVFRPKPPAPPRSDTDLWARAQWNSQHPYTGDTLGEPWVAQQLTAIRASLLQMRADRVDRAAAHRSRDEALLALKAAQDNERRADTETPYRIQAGVAARRQHGDEYAAHLRAEGNRATLERDESRARRQDAERVANERNLQLRGVAEDLTERMRVQAAAAVAPLHEYVALLNVCRTRSALPALPALPADLPEQLVREACRPFPETNPDS